MSTKHYSRKERQLKYLVKKLNILIQKTDSNLKSEIKKISDKIKYLVSQLNGIISAPGLKRILGTIALFIGISFTNTAAAQWFAYPVTNPFGITPGTTNNFQSVNLIDIDNDGDLDLFTDNIIYGYYVYMGNFNFQENIGTSTNPNFDVPESNPFNLPDSIISSDIFQQRHFVDFDGAGDFDVLSNIFTFNYSTYSYVSRYRYYENIGTPAVANFGPAVVNPFGLQDSPNIEFSAIGDIDNDGDFDLINCSLSYGSYYSNFLFIENTGSSTSPTFSLAQANTFGIPSAYGVGITSLTDLDNDGDLDIIFGEYVNYAGQFSFNENTGTANTAQFSTTVSNPYGLNGSLFNSAPTLEFKDLDGDGDLDLLAGTSEETSYFENVAIQQPITYECINYSCVDPGTGSGPYSTLAACQTTCVVPVSYECDWWSGGCYDPGNGMGMYATLTDCQTNCIIPTVTYECDLGFGCYDPGNGMGIYATLTDCQANCGIVTPTWNCTNGSCTDPGTGNGTYALLTDCQVNCGIVTPTWNCNTTLGCIDPADGSGLYASLAGCQANCNLTSVQNTKVDNLKLFPNPVNNTLNISTEKEIKKIEIYDGLGRIILSKENPSTTINVEQLESGIYSIAIIFEDSRILRKFTK